MRQESLKPELEAESDYNSEDELEAARRNKRLLPDYCIEEDEDLTHLWPVSTESQIGELGHNNHQPKSGKRFAVM